MFASLAIWKFTIKKLIAYLIDILDFNSILTIKRRNNLKTSLLSGRYFWNESVVNRQYVLWALLNKNKFL